MAQASAAAGGPLPLGRRHSFKALLFCNHQLWRVQFAETSKRVFDLLAAAIIFALLLPVFLVALFAARRQGGLRRTTCLGRAGRPFERFSIESGRASVGNGAWRRMLENLPVLLNVMRGDMSLVGPRPFTPREVAALDRFAWRRFDVKPGLICLWWIRRRGNIAYRTETETDAEYVDGFCAQRDLGILFRSVPASLYGVDVPKAEEIDLLGLRIHNVTLSDAISRIVRYAEGSEPTQVCFVNADCVNVSFRDDNYKALLQNAGLVLADGIGLKLAGKILKRTIRQNVNGTDLLPELCRRLEGAAQSLYLLGGRPGVAEDVAAWIKQNYPGVTVSGFSHGYWAENETEEVIGAIKRSGARILLVAMGAPQQEKWIAGNLKKTGCSVALGVGGLFDFYAGRVPRAPIWVREIGMEWLFRLIQEPNRLWKRYVSGNFLFLGRVLWARFAKPN